MRQNEFLIGCNYWASNAGCLMWQKWDEQSVRNDMKKFKEAGMNCLRVFPNWADFQPVTPIYCAEGDFNRYAMPDGSRYTNEWFIDEKMIERFRIFCDIAEECNLKLIVGIITGWMSGRLFVPPAIYGLNLFTDTKALILQQKFIEGFVKYLKDKPAIIAWDHGNETDVMSKSERPEDLINWSMMVTNAIKAADNTRPVITGIHSLTNGDSFTLTEHMGNVDVMVTHPYPFWVQYANKYPMLSRKTLLHGIAQTEFYGNTSGKPCLVEEIGTMGPMVCSDETACKFLRINALHSYLYGYEGMLWWNGFDQDFCDSPYLENSCERELGLFTMDGKPKKFVGEMKKISDRIKTLPKVTERHIDAVCILTKGCDAWKTAFATFMLALEAGISVKFVGTNKPIPKADAYIMPNVSGNVNIDKDRWDELKAYVKAGSKLFITLGDGILSEFSEITGLEVEDSGGEFNCEFTLNGEVFKGLGKRQMLYSNAENGLNINNYGNGTVYTLDFSPEDNLMGMKNLEEANYYKLYRYVFKEEIASHPIDIDDKDLGIIWHKQDKLISIFNYSDKPKEVNGKIIPAFDCVIIKL